MEPPEIVASASSVHGGRIRLTAERWAHIMEEHGELADEREALLATISAPERVFRGSEGERLAVRQQEPGKWLVVIYREAAGDGFVITAFLTRRLAALERRRVLWP